MKKDNLVYIEDILNSCTRVLGYVGDLPFEDLAEDQMVIDAVVRNIEVIGEAANKLDEDFKSKNPDFPVRGAVTMRNKLIHDYNMVDPKVVWDTIQTDIPELRSMCERLLQS